MTIPPNNPSVSSVDDDDMFSLDFTSIPVKAAPPPPAPPVAPVAAASPPPAVVTPAPVSAPAPKVPPVAAKPTPPPATKSAVAPVPAPVAAAKPAPSPRQPTPLEEAALLHAAGKTSEAADHLEAALRTGKLGKVTEGGWAMLFDLLQILGRHKAFDNLAVAFVKRFERSAPAWVEPSAAMLAPDLATGGSAFVAIGAKLDANVHTELAQLQGMSEKNPVVRLDLSKVKEADGTGCKLLLDTLLKLKKNKHEYLLGGCEVFIPLLVGQIAVGKREREEAWLLLLELYQHSLQQDVFEETALNYAITFEMSPPSWEAGKTAPAKAAPVKPAVPLNGFSYEGELVAATPATFAPLQAHAAGRDTVVLKFDKLQRIDQVSCDALLHVLFPMHGAHQRIVIRGASPLVATMLTLMGVTRIATVEARRL